MSVGVMLRLVPMAVKLNGVTAATKPSIPRYSILFHVLGEWCLGWSCEWAGGHDTIVQLFNHTYHTYTHSPHTHTLTLTPYISAA